MASDNSTSSGLVRRIASAAVRIGFDLLVITCWVVFLALLFLETGWPRWAFYALLVVGIGVYVTVTATWWSGESTT